MNESSECSPLTRDSASSEVRYGPSIFTKSTNDAEPFWISGNLYEESWNYRVAFRKTLDYKRQIIVTLCQDPQPHCAFYGFAHIFVSGRTAATDLRLQPRVSTNPSEMRLSLRQDWSFQPLSSFLFVLDLKTGTPCQTLAMSCIPLTRGIPGVQLALYFAVRSIV